MNQFQINHNIIHALHLWHLSKIWRIDHRMPPCVSKGLWYFLSHFIIKGYLNMLWFYTFYIRDKLQFYYWKTAVRELKPVETTLFYNRTTNMSKLNATKRETLIFVWYSLHLSLNLPFKSKVKLNYFYYTVVELFTIRSNTQNTHILCRLNPQIFLLF